MRALAAKNEETSLGARASNLNAAGLTTELLVVRAAVAIFVAGPSYRSTLGGRQCGADKEQSK